MTHDEIRTMLEDLKVDELKITEFLYAYNERSMREEREAVNSESKHHMRHILQEAFDDAVDWRKKAAIAARIISLQFDE